MQTDSGDIRIVRAPMFAGTAPLVKEKLKCPRCESHNTKFCYFNNYNLAQPRHYCKECKRYWTQGGTLRNVPVGGGHRKYPQKRSYKPSQTTNTNNNNNSPASSSSTPPSTPPSQQAITAYPISSRPSPVTTGRSFTEGYIQGFTTFFNTVQAYGFMGYNGFEFEQLSPLPLGLPDTPEETVHSGGDYSAGASAWQLGTGSDAEYGADNYYTWPELSISSTSRKGIM